MLVLCSWSFLILFLPKSVLCDLSCKATKSVAATEGEETILQVNRTGITEISWTLKGQHIATTKPNEPIEWKNRQFKTRLGSKPDASLIINKITREDQETYMADMRGLEEEDDFTQCYNVTVYKRLKYEDIEIYFTRAGETICNINVTCTGNEGSNVTWIYISNDTIEEPNHTLYIYHVTPDHSYNCSLKNPVSKVFRTINPWTLCNEGKQYKMVLLAILLPAAIVIFCLLIFFRLKKKLKTFRFRDRPDGFPVNDTSELTMGPVENPYCEILDHPIKQEKKTAHSRVAPMKKDVKTVYFILDKSPKAVPTEKSKQQNVSIYEVIKSH
ncbi:SLAM family member 9 [Xenopus laevis]|uniref:SLAM family member 9 n=2 Tax=Xenopus laevis TaxID=8355 RepID=A0A1L8FCD9_XENLA|nr:SLAM family member 9 [Xenopus laevis]OCT69250.1 hypothetical protein XELAEV_18040561mg [Xenopus laevis]